MSAVFELKKIPEYPAPFPRIHVGAFSQNGLRKFGFSRAQIRKAISGAVVKLDGEHYLIDFCDSFLVKLAIDNILCESPNGRLTCTEIGELLGITQGAARNTLERAIRKLRSNPKAIEALQEAAIIRESISVTVTITD